MTNFEKCSLYLRDLPSPKHFIKANFYFMIASALGRKCWIGSPGFQIFPNIYMFFVGPPGCGKSLPAGKSRDLLKSLEYLQPQLGKMVKSVIIHPHSATYESMLQNIQKAFRTEKIPEKGGKLISHSSMTLINDEEVAMLFRKHTEDIVMFLVVHLSSHRAWGYGRGGKRSSLL